MFNALKYTQEMERAGFSREQAETSMKVLIDVMNENFATKSDMKELEVTLKSDMKELEVTLKSDMKELETSLRSDMKELEVRIKADMRGLEVNLRSEIHALDLKLTSNFDSKFMKLESQVRELENRLTIKLGAMLTVGFGVFATIMKLVPSFHSM